MRQEKQLNSKVKKWENIYDQHKQNQLINPFSKWEGASHRAKLSQDHVDYGTPVAGSGTEKNAKFAGRLISKEMKLLIGVIDSRGTKTETGFIGITFGALFEIFERLSNKVVGLLLIARRHGFIEFEGEMLFQRKDKHTMIYLKEKPESIVPIKYIEIGKTVKTGD